MVLVLYISYISRCKLPVYTVESAVVVPYMP